MRNYVSKEITANVRTKSEDTEIRVSKLQPDCRYIFCVFDSDQTVNSVSINQCVDVKTLPEGIGLKADPTVVFIPVWCIILWCVIFLLLIGVVIGFVAWKKYKPFRSKTPQTSNSHDNRSNYYPDLLVSAHCQLAPYNRARRTQTMWSGYPTNISDRTYAECGPGSMSAHRTTSNSETDTNEDPSVQMTSVENRSYSERLRTSLAPSSK